MAEGEKKQKYKIRVEMRRAGHPPMMREVMPWWYESAVADFAQREAEQAVAAKRGPLSEDPMRPWGNKRERRDFGLFTSKREPRGKTRRPDRNSYDEAA